MQNKFSSKVWRFGIYWPFDQIRDWARDQAWWSNDWKCARLKIKLSLLLYRIAVFQEIPFVSRPCIVMSATECISTLKSKESDVEDAHDLHQIIETDGQNDENIDTLNKLDHDNMLNSYYKVSTQKLFPKLILKLCPSVPSTSFIMLNCKVFLPES